MRRFKELKFAALLVLLVIFLGAGALTSCRDTKKKEDTEMHDEHAEGDEHPEGEEHPTEEGDEHPAGEEHPTKDTIPN
ncbi:MAG: hypothetical protein WBM55_13000 [Muriicola sp.]